MIRNVRKRSEPVMLPNSRKTLAKAERFATVPWRATMHPQLRNGALGILSISEVFDLEHSFSALNTNQQC